MLQLVCAISSLTISFELLVIAIFDFINISESFVMLYLSLKILIILISIELLAVAISGCINISVICDAISPKSTYCIHTIQALLAFHKGRG